jgi:hypothetical protein
MLVMALPRRLGRGAMPVLSHVGDHATKVTWPWCNVGVDDHANMIPGLIYT